MLDSPGSNEALQQTRELKRPSKRDRLNLSKRHAPHPISEMRLAGARPPPAAEIYACFAVRSFLAPRHRQPHGLPRVRERIILFLVKGI